MKGTELQILDKPQILFFNDCEHCGESAEDCIHLRTQPILCVECREELNMGLDYYPNNSYVETYMYNVAGSDAMGFVHKFLGIDFHEGCIEGLSQRIPWDADESKCLEMAAVIDGAPNEKIIKSRYAKEFDGQSLPAEFAGTDEEWVEWVRRWSEFLKTCGGYTTPN